MSFSSKLSAASKKISREVRKELDEDKKAGYPKLKAFLGMVTAAVVGSVVLKKQARAGGVTTKLRGINKFLKSVEADMLNGVPVPEQTMDTAAKLAKTSLVTTLIMVLFSIRLNWKA